MQHGADGGGGEVGGVQAVEDADAGPADLAQGEAAAAHRALAAVPGGSGSLG